jgi:hypothetical protein
LLDLLDGIRDMQAEIDAGGLTMQVAKLASLIEVVQQQIEAIVAPAVRHAEAQAERAAVDDGESAALDGGTESQTDADAPAAPSAAMPEVSWFDGPQQGRAALAAASAQAPARSPSPALAIAAVIEAATAAAATAEPDTPAFTVFKAGTIPPPTPFAGEDFSRPSPPDDAVPPADPLAPITSLSEDERLALFT